MNPSNKENTQLPNIMGYIQDNQLPPLNNSSNTLMNNGNSDLNASTGLNNQNRSNYPNHQLPAVIDGYSNDTNMNHLTNDNLQQQQQQQQ